jgi:acetylornithine/N-succinyldiaminopimelate aminotransferase
MTTTTSAHVTDPFASVMNVTARPDIVFTAGHGSWLTDAEGRDYLDFVQGWAVNCLGHAPQPILDALVRQSARLLNCSPAFYNDQMVALCDLITRHSSLHSVFLANSGAEANEGAIKLARKWGSINRNGAYEIITMDHGFHGRTLATMAASGKAQWDALFEPKVPGFIKVPLNDINAVAAAMTANTVAVMLEPIQGEAGVYEADPSFLKALRALTRDAGILLILDEIQTGIGRTGSLFHYQQVDIEPDVMTLGKGLGGGVPLAALVAHRDVSCFAHGDQGGTFGGNPIMAAVGCAVIETVSQPAFLERVVQAGDHMRAQLAALSQRHGLGNVQGSVRGRGLLQALDLGAPIAAEVVALALTRGLVINGPRPDTLRFMPALTVSDAEISRMIDILDGVLGDVSHA